MLFHSVADRLANLQPAAQVGQVVGEHALRSALVDVGVPAADVDEAEAVLSRISVPHALGLRARSPWC